MELQAYEQRFKSLEEQVEKNSGKFGGIYDRLGVLESDNKLTSYQYTQIMSTVKEIKTELKESVEKIEVGMTEIKNKPAQNWNTLITVLITAVVGGMVGVIISKLFGG